MDAGQLVTLGLVVSAPVTLALIVALIRGYTITVHMTRDGRRWHRRRDQDDDT